MRVSHRGSLLKGWLFKECCIKAYYMQSWLEGRNWVGKCAQATGMTASLRILSRKADSNTWKSFTRSELKLESVHQESPHSDIFRKKPTKPLLKQKHCKRYLTWAKEKRTGASFIKCCAETILKYVYVWFIECTYVQKTHIRLSDVKSMNHKLSWICVQLNSFRSLLCKRCLINVIDL